MQIILVRHGRPAHSATPWSTPVGMKTWVERYNAANIAAGECPERLVQLAGSVGVVLCSSLLRCVESRSCLSCECSQEPDPLFAEAHLPYPDWSLPLMPSRIWRVAFRAAWFYGFANHTEHVGESGRRASAAGDKLIQLAEAHDSVLLVGHRIMNMLIAKQLLRRGWRGPAFPLLAKYWDASHYHKPR